MKRSVIEAEVRMYWAAASRLRELKRRNGDAIEMANCADELAAVSLHSESPLLRVRTAETIRELPAEAMCVFSA